MSDSIEEKVTISEGGTHSAYHVEVRSGTKHPVSLHGKYYGEQWQMYTPEQTCLPDSVLYRHDAYHGLLRYEAAMAIAWAVMAHAQSFTEKDSFGLQARVVESKVEYSYKAVRHKEFPNIPWRGGGDERP